MVSDSVRKNDDDDDDGDDGDDGDGDGDDGDGDGDDDAEDLSMKKYLLKCCRNKMQQPTIVRDLHTAWLWVQGSRELFCGEVTEPAFLEMLNNKMLSGRSWGLMFRGER